MIVRQGPGDIEGSFSRRPRADDIDFDRPTPRAPEIPTRLRQRLAACDDVKVIALAKHRRWTRVLDRDVAWSYAAQPPAADGVAVPPPRWGGGPVRLVISDPRPPVSLLLGRLSALETGSDPRVVALRGSQASPSNVLRRLPEADLIEFHVHGIVDTDVSQHTALVLSPDDSGDFLFSRADLEGIKLARRPIVVLAACETARLSTRRPDANELASAFIQAGSRSVLTSTGKIPDGQGERFFGALRGKLDSGVPVGQALRDIRVAWFRDGGQSWADDVIVYD